MASPEVALPSIIGAAVPRIDGPLKVSGNAMYTADFHSLEWSMPPSKGFDWRQLRMESLFLFNITMSITLPSWTIAKSIAAKRRPICWFSFMPCDS
jgi:hypothetical protein